MPTATTVSRCSASGLLIILGNANTSVEMRVDALQRIQSDLAECMIQLEFEV